MKIFCFLIIDIAILHKTRIAKNIFLSFSELFLGEYDTLAHKISNCWRGRGYVRILAAKCFRFSYCI